MESQSFISFLTTAFLAGFASIFMPCIYPIMPMTVSYFTKQSNGTRKAFIYGLSIMLIFALIGLMAVPFGAAFPNFISTHWLPNLIFFIIFVIFGLSFFGVFEIVLPHETVNKVDGLAEKGGIMGIFFMALTLVLVSFSCTVPIVGSLLVAAANGEVWRPLWGMLAFGLPFALVFTTLAVFPQVLKNLPKSGGWLGELKIVFGFLEFALALKFLSNIDLTYHFNLLGRNTFLVIWILFAFVIGFYIIGLIRMPSDKRVEKWGFLRIAFAALFFGFGIYMIPALSGKPVPLLAGILPPEGYLIEGVNKSVQKIPSEKARQLPHGLEGFYDYDDALAYSKIVNKPVFIDFTGYACANCRKMEEYVWPRPEVLEKLKSDFVIASLYVDDKKELPKEKQYKSTYDDEMKVSVGDKNADLQIVKFNSNSQPFYFIVDTNGNKLVEPVGYTSVEEFIKFLETGKKKFEELK